MDWGRVDYYDVFISCLDSHSDGTHSLQMIHCGCNAKLCKSVLMKKQTHLYPRWLESEYIWKKEICYDALIHF